MNKLLIFGMLLCILTGNVTADCEGSIEIINVPELYPGDQYSIVSTTTVGSGQGVRNWDLTLKDPEGNTVSSQYTRLDNNTYAVTGVVDVSQDFLDGTYTFESKITVLERGNLTRTVCTETATRQFRVYSNRTSYNQVALVMTISPEFGSSEASLLENLSVGGMVFPANFTFKGLPRGVKLNIAAVNVSGNAEINISSQQPMWSYGEVRGLQEAVVNQSRTLDEQVNNLLTVLENMSGKTELQARLDDSIRETANTRSQLNDCQVSYTNCTQTLEDVGEGNNDLLFGGLVGMFLTFAVIVFMETKKNRDLKDSGEGVDDYQEEA